MKMEDSAVALEKLDELTERQFTAITEILQDILDIAQRPQDDSAPDRNYYHRPHQTFLISGGRGDGKTSTLLTLHRFLSRSPDKNANFGETFSKLPAEVLTLPLIIPEEMTANERIMEMVLASITVRIDQELQKCGHGIETGNDFTKKQNLGVLRNQLHREIFDGWTFAEALGLETLSRDAIDYRDFAVRRAEESVRATNRIESWRNFVDSLLNAMNKKVLVVCFDDTDLAPSTADDIMTTMRLYLDHPRIVTLLSAQLEILRGSIEMTRLKRISQIVADCHPLAPELLKRQIEEQEKEVGHLVYKLLPHKFQHPLGLTPNDFLIKGNPLGDLIADKFDELKKLDANQAAGMLNMLAVDHRNTVLKTLREWIRLLAALSKQIEAAKARKVSGENSVPWISTIISEILAVPGFYPLSTALNELGGADPLSTFLENVKEVGIVNNTLKLDNTLFSGNRYIRLYFLFLDFAAEYAGIPQEQIDEWAATGLSSGLHPQTETILQAVQEVSGKQNRFTRFKYFLPSNCLHYSQLLHLTQLKRFSPAQVQQEQYLKVLSELRPLRYSPRPPTQDQLQHLGVLLSPDIVKNEKYQMVIDGLITTLLGDGYNGSNVKSVGANRYSIGGATAYAAWELEQHNTPYSEAGLAESIHRYFDMSGKTLNSRSKVFWNFAFSWLIAEAEKKIFVDALRYMLVCASEIFNGGHSRSLPLFAPKSLLGDMIEALKTPPAPKAQKPLEILPNSALFLAAVVPLMTRLVEIQPSLFESTDIGLINNLAGEIMKCKSQLPKTFPLEISRKEENFAAQLAAELVSDAKKLKQAATNVGKPFAKLDLEAQRKRLNPMNISA